MLFSEPKIPQTFRHLALSSEIKSFSALQRAENSSNAVAAPAPRGGRGFSALQRAENSSNARVRRGGTGDGVFQCSSASRKFLKNTSDAARSIRVVVSVLFSEPKIPQRVGEGGSDPAPHVSVLFSEPKIPQIDAPEIPLPLRRPFQCSSASRKFLKRPSGGRGRSRFRAFQCSSASRKFLKEAATAGVRAYRDVSVLFSEPKIPQTTERYDIKALNIGFSALQRAENSSKGRERQDCGLLIPVSVLFSEPKIPQTPKTDCRNSSRGWGFSALQRAENSSNQEAVIIHLIEKRVSVLFSEPKIPQIGASGRARYGAPEFQCSSASRKFLKQPYRDLAAVCLKCFSALQRAENSSNRNKRRRDVVTLKGFSALQRAENSSNLRAMP